MPGIIDDILAKRGSPVDAALGGSKSPVDAILQKHALTQANSTPTGNIPAAAPKPNGTQFFDGFMNYAKESRDQLLNAGPQIVEVGRDFVQDTRDITKQAYAGGKENVQAGIEKMKSGSPARMLLGAGQDIGGTLQEGLSPVTGAILAAMQSKPAEWTLGLIGNEAPHIGRVEPKPGETPRIEPQPPKVPDAVRAATAGQEGVSGVVDKILADTKRAGVEGEKAVGKVADRVTKPADYSEWIKQFSTPEAEAATKVQTQTLQAHLAENYYGVPAKPDAMQKQAMSGEYAKPAPTPKTAKPTGALPPGTPPKVAELVKKGNNFFADEYAKRGEKTNLPMTQPARKKRAEKMGFRTDLDLYHGTGKSFLEFDISKGHEGAIFVSDKPNISAKYGGAKILPLWGKFQNPLEIDWANKFGTPNYTATHMKPLVRDAKAAGHDVIIIKNINDVGGNQTQYAFLKPENLRARDAAVFDPKKVNSPNLLSAAVPGSTPPVPKLPDPAMKGTVKKLSDDLHRLERQVDLSKREALDAVENLPPEAVKLKQKFFDFLEPGGKKPELTPEEKSIFDKTLKPWLQEQHDLYEGIKKLAPDMLPKDYDPDYVHHLVKGKTPEFDEPLGQVTNEGTYPYMGGQKLPRTTRSLKNSKYYVVEDAAGRRQTVMLDAKGNLYFMQGKKPINVPPKDIVGEVGPGKSFSISGKEWTLKRASVAEKEAATNIKYYKDAYAATVGNVVRLQKVANALKFFENVKNDPEFLQGAWRPGANRPIPKNAMPTTLPGWEGWRFEPRLAEAMDDWHNKPGAPWYENLKNFNHAVLGSLFLLPFRHMMNVGAHWYVGRGWDWLSVPAYVRMAKTTTAAFIDVLKQGPMTRALLKQGSSMMLPRVMNQDFYGQLLKGLGEDMRDGKYNSVLHRIGVKPKELYDGWLKSSSLAMWAFNDVLMQARVRELMEKGKSLLDAIHEAEKDIPNYRINSRIVVDNQAGRAASRFLQNSLFSAFGRYNNNKWRAVADMVKDIAKGSGKDRVEAIGKALALASLVYFVGWPLTAAIKQLSGKNNKQASPFGPVAVTDDLKQIGELVAPKTMKRLGATDDQVQATQLFQSLIGLSPVLDESVTQVTGHNPYTDQPVQTLGERVQSAAQQVSPLGIASGLASGRESTTDEIVKATIGERNVRKPAPPRVQTQDAKARIKRENQQPVNKFITEMGKKLKPFSPDGIVDKILGQGASP